MKFLPLSKFICVHSFVFLYLSESRIISRTKSMKKPTPVKNEEDEGFIKISYLNQENENTSIKNNYLKLNYTCFKFYICWDKAYLRADRAHVWLTAKKNNEENLSHKLGQKNA